MCDLTIAGPWCAKGRLWPLPMPCEACGRPCLWSAACGHIHCPDCGSEDQGDAQPVPAVAAGRGVVCTYPPGVKMTAGDRAAVAQFGAELAAERAGCPNHGPDDLCPDCAHGGRHSTWPAPSWPRRRPGAASRGNTPQPALSGYLATTLELPPDQVTRAVALWNTHMRAIPFVNPHRTAVGILNGTLKWSNIPELPPLSEGALAPLRADGADVWRKRSWLVTDELEPPGGPLELTGWDVNGMYLSAAGSLELGTGEPELVEWPGEDVLALPGWVQVSSLEHAPWSIGDHVSECQWMPTPLAKYLADAGAAFLTPAALVWRTHRRWLRPHVDLFRAAREALAADGTPAGDAVLDIVKDLYTRMFGGLLASAKYNEGPTLRRDWLAQITSTAQARMLRNLDRIASTQVRCVGLFVDCAWLVMPAGFAEPPGLTVDPVKLGAFKPAGRVPWTPELAAAWKDGRGEPLWAALDGGEEAPDGSGSLRG